MTSPEINRDLTELSIQLNSVINNDNSVKGPTLKRNIFRLLELATKGYDLSSLLKDIIMVAAKCEWVDRKLIYYILSLQATSNPEIFLLLINSLRKDCTHTIGTIRAQSLKILCTFPSTLDPDSYKSYLTDALKTALADSNPYVRKTAVTLLQTIRRKYSISLVEFNPILGKLVADPNQEVSAGAVALLCGVVGIDSSLSSRDFFKLLKKIEHIDSWNRCQYLRLMNNFSISTENEFLKIMTRLEHNLHHSHQGVVFGTMEFLINQAKRFPSILPDTLNVLKKPLLNALALGDQELMFLSLTHLRAIVTAYPTLAYTLRYRDFYCRDQDSSFLKQEKINMLADIVAEESALEILEELYLYAVNASTTVAHSSILAISQISVKIPKMSTLCLRKIHEICTLRKELIPFIFTVISICLGNVPSKNGSSILTQFFIFLNDIADSNEAVISFLRILGKYAAHISEVPYILEEFIRVTQPTTATDVYIELLHSTLAAFFQKPSECRDLLGFLMKRGSEPDVPQPVLERTQILYLLLKLDRPLVQRLIEDYYDIHFTSESLINIPKRNVQDFNSLKIILPSWVEKMPTEPSTSHPLDKGKSVLIDLTNNDTTLIEPHPDDSVH